MPENTTPDHDLLIELRTEVKGMRADIKAFNDDTKERLATLETKKLDKDDFSQFRVLDIDLKKDHERRIRNLERWGWLAWGAVSLLEFGLTAYLMYRQFRP